MDVDETEPSRPRPLYEGLFQEPDWPPPDEDCE